MVFLFAIVVPLVVVSLFTIVVPLGIGIARHPSAFWITQLRAIGRSVAVGVQSRQFWTPNYVTGWAGCSEEISCNLYAKRIER